MTSSSVQSFLSSFVSYLSSRPYQNTSGHSVYPDHMSRESCLFESAYFKCRIPGFATWKTKYLASVEELSKQLIVQPVTRQSHAGTM